MKKVLVVGFILVDLAVMAGASLILYMHFSHRGFSDLGIRPPAVVANVLPMGNSSSAPASSMASSAAPAVPTVPTSTSTPVGTANPVVAPAPDAGTRNIKFTYRNPKAHQVSIRAEFTGWKAVSMQRDATGVWTYQVALTPAEYAYCFTVDDKTFKDPANKRTKQIGRTVVSAILVKPNPAPAAH